MLWLSTQQFWTVTNHHRRVCRFVWGRTDSPRLGWNSVENHSNSVDSLQVPGWRSLLTGVDPTGPPSEDFQSWLVLLFLTHNTQPKTESLNGKILITCYQIAKTPISNHSGSKVGSAIQCLTPEFNHAAQ